MRGGNVKGMVTMIAFWGLSPHARGKLVQTEVREDGFGVYPRMRGGNCSILAGAKRIWGLSPHARGKL